MDADGLIRFGGRLKHAHLNNSCKHSVLLPKQEKVTDMVLKWCHAKCAYGGRGAKKIKIMGGKWKFCCSEQVFPVHTVQEVKKETCYSRNGQCTIKQMNGSPTVHLLQG